MPGTRLACALHGENFARMTASRKTVWLMRAISSSVTWSSAKCLDRQALVGHSSTCGVASKGVIHAQKLYLCMSSPAWHRNDKLSWSAWLLARKFLWNDHRIGPPIQNRAQENEVRHKKKKSSRMCGHFASRLQHAHGAECTQTWRTRWRTSRP
jgi:hypothetical protein